MKTKFATAIFRNSLPSPLGGKKARVRGAFAVLSAALLLACCSSNAQRAFDTSKLYFATNGGSFTNYYWSADLRAYTNNANHGWMRTNTTTHRWEYLVSATLIATNGTATNTWTGTNGVSVWTSYWPSSGSSSTTPPVISTNQASAGDTNPPAAVLTPSVIGSGTNAPEGVYAAGKGSIYNQFDGSTNFITQWVKRTSSGNTGWQIVTNLATLDPAQAARLAAVVTSLPLVTNIFSVRDVNTVYATGTGHADIDTVWHRVPNGFSYGTYPKNPAFTNNQSRMLWLTANPNVPPQFAAFGWVMTGIGIEATNSLYYDNETATENYPEPNYPGITVSGLTGTWTLNDPSGIYQNDPVPTVTMGTNWITNICVRVYGVQTNNDIVIDPINGDDSKASIGGFSFKTVPAAMHFSRGGEHWVFKPGTNDFTDYVWVPVNAKVDCDAGAVFYTASTWTPEMLLANGTFELNGGKIIQQPGTGFSQPPWFVSKFATNTMTINGVTMICDHGCVQSDYANSGPPLTVNAFNNTFRGGSYVFEMQSTNTTSFVKNNTIEVSRWNPNTTFAIPLGIYSSGVMHLSGNSFSASNTVSGFNISLIKSEGSGKIFASGNTFDPYVGTSTNVFFYEVGTANGRIYVAGGNPNTNRITGFYTNVVSQDLFY